MSEAINSVEDLPIAKEDRIPLVEKIVFASADMAFNLIWMPLAIFANAYFTDICGIPVSWVAGIFLTVRMFDLVTDVGMGIICDGTNPSKKWGKFRLYMAWGAIPLGIASALVFYMPGFETIGKAIWLGAVYLMLSLLYTLTNVPYSGQMKIMSKDHRERNMLSAFRMVGAQLGVLIISALMMQMVESWGNVTPLPEGWRELANADELKAAFNAQTQQGYFYSMSLFGLIIGVCVLGTALFAKDREHPEAVDSATTKQNLKEMAKCFPWIMLLFTGLLTILAYTIRFGAIVYFIQYYFDEGAVKAWGGEGAVITWFFTSGTLCALAGSAAYGFISRIFDKKIVFIILVALAGVVSILFSLIPPDGITMFIVIQICFSFLMGPTGPIIFSMYTDVADHLKHKNNTDSQGLAMAVGSFCNKMGWSVGPTLSLVVLAVVDYDPNAKVQPANVVDGLSIMLSWGPAIACFLALIFMWRYPLTYKRMNKIQADLKAREAESA